MVDMLRNPVLETDVRRMGVANRLGMVVFVIFAFATSLSQGEERGVHYQHRADLSPGAIGSWQLLRGGPLPGYPQPVEIRAPEKSRISMAVPGGFSDPQPTPFKVGMLIAPVYRLRVTGIPYHEGEEVYPTIEVIDRLYPPAGQAWRFPIPIELTLEDLELALDGRFVIRVIYLEDPDVALPGPDDPLHQRWIDAGPGRDPLRLADEAGRPVAILRIGGRVPLDAAGLSDEQFLYGSPPFLCAPRSVPYEGAIEYLPSENVSPLPELLPADGL
jgi:hypothetical protein